MFNKNRLGVARRRRRLTGKRLAELADVSPITISRIENGDNPDDETVGKLARALGYPIAFFHGDDPEEIDTGAVSFRSLTKMTAKDRDAAIAAGSLGLELSDWVEKKFSLPKPNLLDLSYETEPEAAARSLRQCWGLGEKPLGNVLGLLEVQGVRIFSLSEKTDAFDAFSFWRNDKPFIFLNNFKTPEHSVFDSVHELGHLCLHRHAGIHDASRSAEQQANAFASAFLMPANDVRSRMSRFITVDTILEAKKRWRVSAMAMAYRLHTLGLVSDWQYKSHCIELGRRGYRSSERGGIERETSRVWQKVLTQLWAEKKTKTEIAADLNVPMDEIESLVWGLTGQTVRPDRREGRGAIRAVT